MLSFAFSYCNAECRLVQRLFSERRNAECRCDQMSKVLATKEKS